MNWIYNILAELPAQDKKKSNSAHIGIKRNEEARKKAIDIAGMITTSLLCTENYLTIRRARNSIWQM